MVLNYEVLDEFEIVTKESNYYGKAPYAGRDDRIAYILKAYHNGKEVYVLYHEGYYHYDCVKNKDGYNYIQIEDDYILVESDTTDYGYQVCSSYEEARKYLYSFEDNEYYIVK